MVGLRDTVFVQNLTPILHGVVRCCSCTSKDTYVDFNTYGHCLIHFTTYELRFILHVVTTHARWVGGGVRERETDRQTDRQSMCASLDECLRECARAGVNMYVCS